ncbi:MarR family winged helix-turn-helix transcriptional regulator [Actinoplanes sp. NPDC051851]|uniref:MarR family winged helix-turn-helix transcriptional regulator n=1 Tax=Actinoplanes sp. NPDC051851 TaxID=3154753 RepID=UPI00343AC86A
MSDAVTLGLQIGPLLARAHHRAARAFAEALVPIGIDGRIFGVLSTVDRLGPSTQARLSAELGADKSNMLRTVDELERRGFVERRAVPGDRRARTIALTPAGQECLATAQTVAREVAGHLFGDMDPAQLTVLRDALKGFVLT